MYMFSSTATQNLWDELMADEGHYFETSVSIYNGVTPSSTYVSYSSSEIINMSASYQMFSGQSPSVGGCISGSLTLTMLNPPQTIPRMALIIPYVRVANGLRASEWMPHGRFWIDTRETTKNDDGLPVLSIHAYDAMPKAEADYPSTSHAWPYPDIDVVREIASTIGIGVDPRTVALMTRGYSISLPGGYSMREVLSNIAAMYAGNFFMSYDGELVLAAINGIPVETNYLTDAVGDAITFGGDRILV